MDKKAVALVLGGAYQREDFALTEWHEQNPGVQIFISGGSTTKAIYDRFGARGGKPPLFINDTRAKTTNGNFTSLADEFKAEGYKHVYVLTSYSHLKRAMVLAKIILGSRGLSCEGVMAHYDPERVETTKVLFESSFLACLWVALGPLGDKVLGSKFYQ